MGILKKHLLLIILLLTLGLRLYRIDFPNSYVFDEVYHAFTAKEYLKGNKLAWDPWAKPPPGVAYEWTHPPLAKEIMTVSMFLTSSTDAWAWRLPGVLLGLLSILMVYLLGKAFFKDEIIALTAAFLFSIDGLNFVQGRTGMNDIYVVTFTLISLYFFIKKKFLISAIFVGLSLASKWTGIYLLGFYFLLLLWFEKHQPLLKQLKNFLVFLTVPPLIYLASYIPYFSLGYNWTQFIELQKQMWGYHTGLKAHHDYASAWWSWPFNLYPVWYYVQYFPNKIANIFASGNLILFLFGVVALVFNIVEAVTKRSAKLLILVLGYFVFLLPWALSPRIAFLYHYSPSVPFLSLGLGYQISKFLEDKNFRIFYFLSLGLIMISFLLVYPFLTGVPLPKEWVLLFFKTNLAKNPFGG